jgi:hypothetical protein
MPINLFFPLRRLGLAALLAAALAACGGGGGAAPAAPPPVTAETVTLSAPVSQALAGGKAVALSAATGSGAAPAWTLGAGNPGSLSAASGASVNYLPPASAAAATTVTVTATVGGASKSVTLTLYPDPGAPALSLIAGGAALPVPTLQDGPGASARFINITDVSGDGAGNFYVADSSTVIHSIRKVSANGTVTTLLATLEGSADGDNAHARLGDIRKISAAADGGLYMLDYANGSQSARLRKLGTDGSVTTLFGGMLVSGNRMAVAPDGTIYLMENINISTVTPAGVYSLLAGHRTSFSGPGDGTGSLAGFSSLRDIALGNDGNLYAADGGTVRKITPDGVVTTVAGSFYSDTPDIDGPVDSARFNRPLSSLAVDAGGNILVREYTTVRKISSALQVSTVSRNNNAGNLLGIPPDLLRISAGNVVQASAVELRLLTADGSTVSFAGQAPAANPPPVVIDGQGAAARFEEPQALAATPDGTLYVLDKSRPSIPPQYTLRRVSPGGLVSTVAAPLVLNPANSGHSNVTAIAADRAGTVYLIEYPYPTNDSIDQLGGAVYKLGADGVPVLLAGVPSRERNAAETYDLADGSGGAVHFNYPVLAGFDADNNLYLSDRSRDSGATAPVYRKLTPQGVATTIAALPAGLNPAPDGNTDRYSADSSLQVVFRVQADSTRTVAAGVLNHVGDQLGALPGLLSAPKSVVQLSPYTYALISGSRVVKLVVPH